MRTCLSILAGLLIYLVACTPRPVGPGVPTAKAPTAYPKNVILLIGDGMGLGQITGGMFASATPLHLERFKQIGLHKPYSSDNLITDSAAGATAFAAGVKTYNGAIGVDAQGKPVTTLLEMAERRGLATGMVATSTIVHATPASFIAHQPQRKMYEEIAADFLKTEIDFFVGGGKKFFTNREDGRDLLAELRQKGYDVSDFFAGRLTDFPPDPARNYAYLTSESDPLPVLNGRDYLLPATRLGLDFLPRRSEKGFFYMIEGSQIDWGGHSNNSEYIISEVQDFDKAVGAALDFAERDGETLVVVTADHETGGYAINYGSRRDSIIGVFTSDYHTATLIPVFAYGPGSEQFAGIYENTAIFDKLKMLLRF